MSSVAATAVPSTPPRVLHWSLWGVQGLLALAFLGAGVMKSTTPLADLAKQMPWVADAPSFLPRFIGVSELLGAVGLILPAALRIAPILTPIAASALTLVMVLASLTHASYGEWGALPVNAVLGGLAAFVAWGRFGRGAIASR
jgi:uncharacterized membrane protein YphA (DoxX/SURF4 family)